MSHRSLATRALAFLAAICSLFLPNRAGFAANAADATPPAVHVKYATGRTILVPITDGVKFFTNKTYELHGIPAELLNLTFTRRPGGQPQDAQITAPAGARIYVLVDSEKADVSASGLNQLLTASGWIRLPDAQYVVKGKQPYMAVYRQDFSSPRTFTISGAAWSGIAVAARSLEVDTEKAAAKKKDAPPPSDAAALHADTVSDTAPVAGPTAQVAVPQTAIKSLDLYTPQLAGAQAGVRQLPIPDAGVLPAQTAQVGQIVLTITRGQASKLTTAQFAAPISDQTGLARDEALRYIHLTYPNWYADRADISFDDNYPAHDSPSIGPAIGVLILSAIQGFDIDSDIAITGDLGPTGKIRPIPGLAARLHAAIQDHCPLAAIPADNYPQLTDAVIYDSPTLPADIQIIGISTLPDAVAAVRVDRDANLAQAIDLFAALREAAQAHPGYLRGKEAQAALDRILALAPQHLSARLLLAIAQAKLPRTLSVAASDEYAFQAIEPMLTILKARAAADFPQPPAAAVAAGLATLRKLRPLADPAVRPLIDASTAFITAWTALQQGSGSIQSLQSRRQSLLDELAKQQGDPEMLRKMLEGF